MKLSDRYLAYAILKSVTVVLVALVLLMNLAALVGELDDVGEGSYALDDAVSVVGLTTAERAVDLFAVSALVGGILGLGALASGSEITVLRASGMSPMRMGRAAVLAAIPLMIVVVILMEFVVPPLSRKADVWRRVAVAGSSASLSDHALWFHDPQRVTRVGSVRLGGVPRDITVFERDETGRVLAVVAADHGEIRQGGRWVLHGVRRDVLGGANPEFHESYVLDEMLGAGDLGVVFGRATALAPSELHRRLTDSADGARSPDGKTKNAVAAAYWQKLATPFLIAVMCALAVPFVLGRGGSLSTGRHLVLGALVGVGSHLLIGAIGQIGIVLELSAPLVAAAPVLILGAAAYLLLARA